jgi:ketosteroid isomerase-like protein
MTAMHSNERVVRQLYDARARRDWDAARALCADEITWHEPGEEEPSAVHRGQDQVVALFEQLVAVTDGTIELEPEAFLNSADHSVVLVRWSGERAGQRAEGTEIAVYRLRDSRIEQVWFYVDSFDPESFSAVFGTE